MSTTTGTKDIEDLAAELDPKVAYALGRLTSIVSSAVGEIERGRGTNDALLKQLNRLPAEIEEKFRPRLDELERRILVLEHWRLLLLGGYGLVVAVVTIGTPIILHFWSP